MNKKILATFLITTMILTGFIGVWASSEDNLTTELRENLISLDTTLAESGFDDLMPLKEILKDKRIIGMGEATHGTAEFFQMKHRTFEFLVKEMGYKAFAMEVEFGTTSSMNNYILGKGNSLPRAMDTLGMWTWNTKEVADMITWMRGYNESVEDEDKIRFYGFDMQSIYGSFPYVLEYLSRFGSHPIEGYDKNLVEGWEREINPIKRGKEEEFRQDIDNIHNELLENKDEYINHSSLEEYDLVFHQVETIYQYLNFIDLSLMETFDARDLYMAENVKWILDYENKHYNNDKIMLWAHNGHITNERKPNITMGSNLKDIYGDEYYSIGFDFYKGSFVATNRPNLPMLNNARLSNFHIDSTEKVSFAYEMMKTNIPISFIDFQGVRGNDLLSDFLSERIHVNYIGAAYSGPLSDMSPYNKIILQDSFDGMIFIESTTAAERFNSRELADGSRSILIRNILYIVLVLAGIFGIIISAIRIIKDSKTEDMEQYYILNKDSVDRKGLKGLIIKINNYFNSISSIKYIVFSSLTLTLLRLIFNMVNSYVTYSMLRYSNLIFIVVILFNGIVSNLITILLCYILPLKILKSKLSSKLSNLSQIIITSIIATVINLLRYQFLGVSGGIGLSSLYISIVLIFIKAMIYCYIYDFFYTKNVKPIPYFILILTLVNIFILLLGI